MNINTIEYWDKRFADNGNWVSLNGLAQTKDFMQCIVKELPDEIKHQFNGWKIADVGCGIATGVDVLNNSFGAELTGIDFSEVAIEKNKELYPDYSFTTKLDKKYDVIISSNVLEHVDDPLEYMTNLLRHSSKFLVVLVPYNEKIGDIEEHINIFDDYFFKDKVNGFKKVFQKAIKTKYWMWEQLLVVYEKVGKK